MGRSGSFAYASIQSAKMISGDVGLRASGPDTNFLAPCICCGIHFTPVLHLMLVAVIEAIRRIDITSYCVAHFGGNDCLFQFETTVFESGFPLEYFIYV